MPVHTKGVKFENFLKNHFLYLSSYPEKTAFKFKSDRYIKLYI